MEDERSRLPDRSEAVIELQPERRAKKVATFSKTVMLMEKAQRNSRHKSRALSTSRLRLREDGEEVEELEEENDDKESSDLSSGLHRPSSPCPVNGCPLSNKSLVREKESTRTRCHGSLALPPALLFFAL